MVYRLSNWERAVAWRLMLSPDSPWLWLPSLGAHMGDSVLWLAISGALLAWGSAHVRWVILVVLAAMLFSSTVATIVKYAVRRSRPRERDSFYSTRYDRYSFPSGHATRMAATAVVLASLAPAWAPLGYGLALIVCVCRIVIGIHYPSDVLVGLLIGLVGAWCILLCL